MTPRDLRSLARRAEARVSRAASRVDAATSADDLHRMRIAAKRARYAAEAVERFGGKGVKRLARRLAALQDILGDFNDAVVAADWLRARPMADPAAAFEAGELAGTLDAMARAHAGGVPRALRRAGLV